ncbi:MAG TPA: chorismate lyase [Gammaproteobacteria bacterium]
MTTTALQDAQTWKPVAERPAARCPAALWSFIAEAGSLTERLRAKAGAAFRVQLINQGHFALSEEDMLLLDAKPEEAGFVRQVYLWGRAPLVYARSLAVGGAERWLKDLGEQPLGERVFAEADAKRGPIQVAELDVHDHLYKEAVAGLDRLPETPLWARRSLITVGGAGILIYECFLPGLSHA